jgi:hypothetical protein
MHLQTRTISTSMCVSEFNSIMASKSISELLDLGLQMHLQMHLQTRLISAFMCISEFNSISASKCISKPFRSRPSSASMTLTRSRPASASPNSLDHGPQVHLPVHMITASKCISKSSQSIVSRCPCDYAPVLSAARLAVCIYIE